VAASTDRSVAEVHSPTLRSVHTHETVHDGAIATMRPATFTVPAHGSLQLRPGGKHLMIAGLPEGIDEVPLRFALDVGGGWFTVPVRSR
jgi:copper(I)-binding protein